jgi:hypothetical protein
MRDQKPRLRKFACLAAIAAMLALSGRAVERDLDDQLLVRLPAPPRELCGILGDEAIRRRGLPAFG